MLDDLFRSEKDSLILVGLLARALLEFDPAIPVPSEPAPTHFAGLNIHACIVDNVDGELLGIERNQIHLEGNPVEHGEQRALRTAIDRVLIKRPRTAATTVEQYYRNQMFMAKGSASGDFLRLGGTCYTTLEPCPMCASTLLVARMKRVVFILSDAKYGGAWLDLKKGFYPTDESAYESLAIDGSQSPMCLKAAELLEALCIKTAALRKGGTRDTLLLDFCRDELIQAATLLQSTKERDLSTSGADRASNAALLSQFKRACNFPHDGH